MTDLSPDVSAAMTAAGLVPGQSPSPVRLPDAAALFGRRAERLRRLAVGHGLENWLTFIAELSAAQHLVVAEAAVLDRPQDQAVRDLQALLAALNGRLSKDIQGIADALRFSDTAELAARVERLAAGESQGYDLASAPFLAAADQVAWTRHAAKLSPDSVTATATAHQCPVCGNPPVVGMVHVGADQSGLRYLHCACCHTAWHHVRATCVACGESKSLSQRLIEGQDDGVRAETCDSCHSYLKLMLLSKNPDLDPIADDLASLTLDILVGEEGYQRIGGNPFLVLA